MDSTNFNPPARRSMTDAEIQDALGNAQADEAGIMAAMELLETQAQLRDIEKMEFSSWVIEMERIGSPEALLAVENANRAQQGLPPLDSPTVVPQPIEPIEDVVSRLNDLYANQSVVEPIVESTPAVEATPEEFVETPQIQIDDLDQVEPEIAPFFVTSETADAISTGIDDSNDSSEFEELDEFDRLLAADTVVGAEDELTALEEELLAEVSADPIASVSSAVEESFTVSESDPGVVFASSSVIEEVTMESAPKTNRRSNSISQFWAWLTLSGSVLPLGLAWYVSSTGIAFSQAVLAIFLGATASAIVVGVGALAGKRSGLPTLMLSRAAFGVYANAAPASVLSVIRILWSAAIVVVLLVLGAEYLKVESLTNYTDASTLTLGGVIFAIVAAAVTLAIFGGRVLFRAQQISGIIGLLAVATLVTFTAGVISVDELLAQSTSSWPAVFGIAVLTFSIFGLAWTSAGADFARKLTTNARGAAVVGWGVLALAVVPTTVAAYGLAFLSSAPGAGVVSQSVLSSEPASMLQKFSELLVPWLGFTLAGSAVVTFIVVLAMSLYSSNLGLHSIGAKLKPVLAQPILGLIALSVAVAAVLYLPSVWDVLADYALLVGVPVAAWSGIFVADILIRRIAYHEISLSRGYGFYKSINWVNLSAWVIATALGLGLIYSDQPGFSWTGFLADLMINQEFWSTTSFGIIIAFAFGSLMPVVAGIPRIKRQEAEVLAIESRRDDLKDIFGLAD
jgi:purine-cytosine permease-like protein